MLTGLIYLFCNRNGLCEEKLEFFRVWQLWMAAMVHLIEFTVLAEPLGCSVPRQVPVLWRHQELLQWQSLLAFQGSQC